MLTRFGLALIWLAQWLPFGAIARSQDRVPFGHVRVWGTLGFFLTVLGVPPLVSGLAAARGAAEPRFASLQRRADRRDAGRAEGSRRRAATHHTGGTPAAAPAVALAHTRVPPAGLAQPMAGTGPEESTRMVELIGTHTGGARLMDGATLRRALGV